MSNTRGKITKSQLSQSLLEEIISYVSGSQQSSILIEKHTVKITAPIDRIYIGNDFYNKETDELLVFKNSVYCEENEDYIFNQENRTIMPVEKDMLWQATEAKPCTFNFVCLIKTANTAMLHGDKIVTHSIDETKFTQGVINKLNDTTSPINGLRMVNKTIGETKLSQELIEKINSKYVIETGRSSYTVPVTMFQWSDSVNINNCYTKVLKHNLYSSNISVTAINSDNRRSVPITFRIINDNIIEIECNEKLNLTVSIIDINEINIVSSNDINCIFKPIIIEKDMWLLDEESNIYIANIEYNGISSVLNVYDTENGMGLLMSYKKINDNIIQLRSDSVYNCTAIVSCKTNIELRELDVIESLKLEIRELNSRISILENK